MTMMQKLAWAFGIIFVAVGVLGFIPGVTNNGLLLGIFQVDTMHNIVHLLSGIVAIVAALGTGAYARLYFKVFGVVYALVAVLGLTVGAEMLGMMMNMADHILHVVLAAALLWVGFGMKEAGAPMAASSSAAGASMST